MKHYKVIFFKQDVLRISTLIFLALSIISGGSIIFSREYLGGGFEIRNVYAMFATISNLMIIFMAVSLFGREFQSRTINMIRISKRSSLEIFIRKLAVMVVASLIIGLVSYAEVASYCFLYHREMEYIPVLIKILSAYFVYGVFTFAFVTPFVMLAKNTLHAFVAIIIVTTIIPMLLKIFGAVGIPEKVFEVVPFTFMNQAFSFAEFTPFQTGVMVVWSAVLLVVSYILFDKEGYT